MPWSEVDDETAINLLDLPGTHFVLFYASGDPPWCSDCRDAHQSLHAVFGADDAPPLNVVRVGTQPQWKTADNKWKVSEFRVNEIPLVLKLIDGKEVGRVGEQECKSEDKLQSIV